jgi:hypothetical protein
MMTHLFRYAEITPPIFHFRAAMLRMSCCYEKQTTELDMIFHDNVAGSQKDNYPPSDGRVQR